MRWSTRVLCWERKLVQMCLKPRHTVTGVLPTFITNNLYYFTSPCGIQTGIHWRSSVLKAKKNTCYYREQWNCRTIQWFSPAFPPLSDHQLSSTWVVYCIKSCSLERRWTSRTECTWSCFCLHNTIWFHKLEKKNRHIWLACSGR